MTMRPGEVRYAMPRFHVPMITPQPEGDPIEGRFRVPRRLVRTKEHTNERLEFEGVVKRAIRDWDAFRERLGWERVSKPKVRGPYDPPRANAQAEMPDWTIYTVTARFKPLRPMSMKEEDWWEMSHRAAMYGVDLWQPAPVETPLVKSKAVITDDGTPFHNPLVEGAKTIAAHGRTQQELLIGTQDVRDPL